MKENLILFNGTIIYTGHNDIKSDEIDKELTLYSPDKNAIWLHFEIKNSSEFFVPNYRIEKNNVIIERSLWKNNDYINFVALIDSKKNKINISHRIYNVTSKIRRFRESDAALFKINAVMTSLALIFITSTTSLVDYFISPKSSKNDTLQNSIFSKKLELDETYYINARKINIDELQKKREEMELNRYDKQIKKELDSLTKLVEIHKKHPSDKNHIKVLEQALNAKSIKYPFRNDYDEISSLASSKTDTLILNNLLDTSKLYILNDSTKIKFSYNNLRKKGNDEKLNFLSAFIKIIPLAFILFILYSVYSYVSIKRLTKKINVTEN
ncbi:MULTISPECIES: hypothetical protein [Sphingobacterium]|uniref:hypothetical protein n=1 Tax=Sphingobacterium TaxID=28453 RepID=UPI0028981C47|nr:hypothetical protein [Sphingobacterium multivorum]